MKKQIYIITCGINGKQYVGQTNRKIRMRIDAHFQQDQIIDRSIKKYGSRHFLFQVIEGLESQKTLDEMEKSLIIELSTQMPNGYNLREGGRGGTHHEATRRKLSKSHTGKKLSEEHIRNIVKTRMGEKHYLYGKHHSEETRRKISETKKGRDTMPEETRRKISEERIGQIHSKETIENMSKAKMGEKNPMYGKKLTEEHKRKLSEAHIGKQKGEKHPMYGKHPSEETRKKQSESAKKRWDNPHQREKQSIEMMGEKNPMYGKHLPRDNKGRFKKEK